MAWTELDTAANAGASASGASISVSRTYTGGERAVVWVTVGGASTITVTDGTNTYTQVGSQVTASSGDVQAVFECASCAAGTFTVQANFGTSNAFRGIAVHRFSGLTGSGSLVGAAQTAPGTGADGLSSGNLTPASQPALLLGIATDFNGSTVNVGTGFTSSAVYTNVDTANGSYTVSETKRLTSTSAVPATATATSSPSNFLTLAYWAAEVTGPTITAQPSNQTVNNGATASFSVTATGATSYQWQDNSSGSFANISGATSSSYAPTASYSMQGRLYRCVVTNSGGSVNSDAATLRVAFNLTGTGPRAYPVLGGVMGAGSVESWLRGTDAGGGGGATVNGQTLTVTASVIAGSVTAASTVSGQTATSTASVIAGAVQAAATVSGQVVNATASLIAGAVTAAATVNGQTATVNASVLAGTASGGGSVVVNGQTLTVNASVIAGTVEAAALVDSQILTVVASAIAGTVQAAATIAGQLLTSTASVIAGAVTAAADVAGQTLTVNASVLAGTASGGGAATVNGQTITATASVIAGAVTGAAVVDGQLLTVNASVIAGGAFVPSGDATLQSKALRTGIGMGL